MFVRITSAATAIALLAHSLLGCCWHHVHADCAGHELACLHAGTHHEHHYTDHPYSIAANPAGSQHDDDVPAHRHRAPCVEPNCSFVGTEAPQLIDMSLIGTSESNSGTARSAGMRGVEAGCLTRIDCASLSTARMRAALQCWLI